MPKYIVEESDRFGEDCPTNTYIKITEGEFKDVCFNFGEIEFLGEDEQGNAQVHFNYKLLEQPEELEFVETSETRERFETEIALLLHDIIMQGLEKMETEGE